MRFALSTNWNNTRLNDGAAIADEAGSLGFDALELGFKTSPEQLVGIKSRLDRMPVDSVHAYCPIPVGAPSGHPELHQLLVQNEDERALARLLLRKTFACAADLGAKVVVFHTGYVDLVTFFRSYGAHALRAALARVKDDVRAPSYRKTVAKALALRARRGKKLLDLFRREIDLLIPDLERFGLLFGLENLPRIEGFPNVSEAETIMKEYAGSPVRLWFDTGHARVRACHDWSGTEQAVAERLAESICGIHLNDVKDFHDDHRQPGWGNVDFAALAPLGRRDLLRVFEPHEPVTADELKTSLARIRALWSEREVAVSTVKEIK